MGPCTRRTLPRQLLHAVTLKTLILDPPPPRSHYYYSYTRYSYRTLQLTTHNQCITHTNHNHKKKGNIGFQGAPIATTPKQRSNTRIVHES
ncbi:hypothetical protein G7K_1059-t1 [Saitoella complicata NRRL Y-17804]|uniref:Uncharacterized protein n=1 Tax=Saitoella complicata (strain BCRC 22490 / CBS 7301 / JCM 7358 / NBRC 10748 / NRRL Y-17804) TaxID=698492 RepID=A0A0E9NAU7_SAICN|nr:hypothetical protein G7K_1059-t1 [Saitoella complicata NRRL Y-17804]